MQELSSLRRRLGGRSNLDVYAGRAAPCPERKLKSATTCFRAGSYLPAAGPMPVTAVRSQISKATIMTLSRPMFPPRAESVDSFSLQPAIGQPESQTLTGDPPGPIETLVRMPPVPAVEVRQ